MMAHQSALAAEGADEHDQYWELVWANLVRKRKITFFHLYYLETRVVVGMC